MPDQSVVVIGGGVAGIAAAAHLASPGVRPILIEKRPFLGGRAFSYVDPETGTEVDNGQHVFLGACTEYIHLLEKIGALPNVRLSTSLDIPVLLNGRIARLRSSQLPGNSGMVAALAGYGHVSWAGKIRIGRGMASAWVANRFGNLHDLEHTSFGKWLRWHGQTDREIERFWNLITLAALNDHPERVSARAGVMLIRNALLRGPGHAAVGWSTVGLTTLIDSAARRFIEQAKGYVITGTGVSSIETRDGYVRAVNLENGSTVRCSYCILAVPVDVAGRLLPEGANDEVSCATTEKLEASPIVAVHIWYDRQVIERDFTAVINSPLQWVFNVSSLHGENNVDFQHVVISVSGAHSWICRSKADLETIFVSEMARQFPAARGASVRKVRVIKNLNATIRPAPGTERYRPAQRTGIRGLYLAGDWTATGWPSTTESAARSGSLAAVAVLEDLSPRNDQTGIQSDTL